MSFAARAVSLTNRRDPAALDALAAAYAADGRFDQAIVTARAAVDLLHADNQTARANEIGQRLELYQQRLPYIDVRGAGPVH